MLICMLEQNSRGMRFLGRMEKFQQELVSFYGQHLHLQHKMDNINTHKGIKPLIRSNKSDLTTKLQRPRKKRNNILEGI